MSLQPMLGWRARTLRWLLVLLLLAGCGAGGAWYGYRYGLLTASERMSAETRGFGVMQEKLDRAVEREDLLKQQLKMTEAARDSLASAVAAAEQEAARARQSLSFFDALLTTNDRSRTVSFAGCELQPGDTQNRWRWRLLAVQGVDRASEFSGQLEVTVSYQVSGKRSKVDVKPQLVRFRHYGRLEGDVDLPANAKPEGLEARLMIDGQKQVAASCTKKPGGV
ncbi:DUF6776 family protein [Andreprevotia chitinilytica]|uniref:DUF6776 family protein n=1 Tax=Andreprevotia chitinilytica TaxID=396808 RepID=UPI000556EE29|nr:DUF6776 family protein [Andreprevotia chitinilytica]